MTNHQKLARASSNDNDLRESIGKTCPYSIINETHEAYMQLKNEGTTHAFPVDAAGQHRVGQPLG